MEVILITLILIAILCVIYIFKSKKEENLGWKFRRIGEGELEYSQELGGEWHGIRFQLELYASDVPRHKIIIPENWDEMPEWSQLNKDIILKRLKIKYKEPEYTIVRSD